MDTEARTGGIRSLSRERRIRIRPGVLQFRFEAVLLIGWVWLLWVPAQSLAGENCKLGVQVKAHQFGMQIVVEGVDSGSPAEKAGLRRGDQLLMVGNVATFGTKSIEEMKSALDATPCGEVIRVMFRRNGIPQTVDIQLGSAGEQDSAKEPGSATSPTGIAS